MAADWAKAKIMFEMGKSLNQISNELGIDKGNISKKAKKDNWQKGKLQPLIQDAVRVQEAFTTLSQPELVAVINERDDILRFKNKRDNIIDLAFDRIASELLTCEVQHIKSLVEAADKTCVMADIAPRFNPNSMKINKTPLHNKQSLMVKLLKTVFIGRFCPLNHTMKEKKQNRIIDRYNSNGNKNINFFT